MLAQLFEPLCNDNRLSISMPKAFVTVSLLPPDDDAGMHCSDDVVFVGGRLIEFKIYAQWKVAAQFLQIV